MNLILNKSKSATLVCLYILGFLSSACTSSFSLPSNIVDTTIQGTLTSTPLDLVHSTTHIFTTDTGETFLTKSAHIFLRTYEHKKITILGTITYTKNSLPILTITSVQDVLEPELVTNTLPTLGIKLSLPIEWQLYNEYDSVRLSNTSATGTLLKINKTSGTVLPSGVLVQNTIIPIIHITTENGLSEYYIQSSVGIIRIQIVSQLPALLLEEFLSSITLLPVASSSSAPSSTSLNTSSAMGSVCGGTAGLLCQPGYFCNVTDTVTNIGRCKAL